DPKTNDTLTASVTSHDPDGDRVASAYQWYRGEMRITDATASTLDLSVYGDRGDRIHVSVTPSDGTLSGDPVSSSAVTVANTAPVIDSVVIRPAEPKTNDMLTAIATGHDADGDSVAYAYRWYQGDSLISGANGSTLDLSTPGYGDRGNQLRVSVTPSDDSAS